ncbi:DUF4145 domain-containing protein [Algoriphagus aquimarinus]|uniref:DUF4145 domain-containing protein n=1 Tax=Algoriphagus aquimarinus TaxID=237018 RepID=A0A1I1B358_9BACT|nr:DUF4145 domain-containing protein [Algoriphagus aquimarinus]SFB42963.1 protein of unknown function [Algoriphagus aquimarinus]
MESIKKRVVHLQENAKAQFEKLKKNDSSFNIGAFSDLNFHDESMEIYYGTISVLENIYGKNSSHIKELLLINNKILSIKYKSIEARDAQLLTSIIGILSNLKYEIENDLLVSIEKSISKEIFTDFISFSKEQYSSGDLKICSVLICAALEDSLKKIADINGLNVTKKSMAEIINALKSKGIIQKNIASLLEPYTRLRNKVFHADWESFDKSEIGSLIAFTEEFVKDHFK